MFGFLKMFKRKPEEPAEESRESGLAAIEAESFAEPELPLAAAVQLPGRPAGNGGPYAKSVQLSLRAVLSGLPLELQPRVKRMDVGESTISIPLEKILSQLSRGAVKISFGELRLAIPQLFSPANDRDRVLVPLPLAGILSQLNPA